MDIVTIAADSDSARGSDADGTGSLWWAVVVGVVALIALCVLVGWRMRRSAPKRDAPSFANPMYDASGSDRTLAKAVYGMVDNPLTPPAANGGASESLYDTAMPMHLPRSSHGDSLANPTYAAAAQPSLEPNPTYASAAVTAQGYLEVTGDSYATAGHVDTDSDGRYDMPLGPLDAAGHYTTAGYYKVQP